MKAEQDVIADFNEYVNMTADELEEWLKTSDSTGAGWHGSGDAEGETVGHDSGRHIVDILKRNPEKAEDKYTEEDLQHMRKVVAYCKRHLAQEDKMKETKTPEELEQTKSTKSLKNWGHDPLKTLDSSKGNGTDKAADTKDDKAENKEAEAAEDGKKEGDKSETGEGDAENGEKENGNAEGGEEPAKPKRGRKPGKAAAKKTEQPSTGRSQPGRAARGQKLEPESGSEEEDEEDKPAKKRKTAKKPAAKRATKKTDGDEPAKKAHAPRAAKGKAKVNDEEDDNQDDE